MGLVFVLFLLLLALPPTIIVSYLILKKNWRPMRTLVVDVPYGVLCGVLLAWLIGLRGWDLLIGALVGGALAYVAMRTRAKDIEAMDSADNKQKNPKTHADGSAEPKTKS